MHTWLSTLGQVLVSWKRYLWDWVVLTLIMLITNIIDCRCMIFFFCSATKSGEGIMLYHQKFWVSIHLSIRPSISPSIILVCSITLLPSEISSPNFTQMYSTMRRCAEHMTRNSGLPTFRVIALWTLNIISTMFSSPLRKLKTVRDIFTKLHTNIKHSETTCRTHEP